MSLPFLHVTKLICAIRPIVFQINEFVDPMLMNHTQRTGVGREG